VGLSTEDLDAFARAYYLNDQVADIDIEELQQAVSLSVVLEAIEPARRVLEMGFGTGLITDALLRRGVAAEVVEGSPILHDLALHRHGVQGLRAHLSLFEEFTPTAPYDGVLALHVLEHVDDPQLVLRRVRSWMVPGGTLVVVTPNKESVHRNLAVRMGLQPELDSLSDRDRFVGHQRVYSIDTLTAELQEAGFRVERSFGYFLKVLPNSMMLDWDRRLLEALNTISEEIPPRLLANIGIRAVSD
jgi:2-polyprenyl-3-methyl-5-hydroxy-6-metoxy-1,4-benzoquinol methylase